MSKLLIATLNPRKCPDLLVQTSRSPHPPLFVLRALQGRECAWKLVATVPNPSKIPTAEESNESSIPPLSGAVIEQLAKIYAEPQLRASQIQLDKNAEPPWDPDPIA